MYQTQIDSYAGWESYMEGRREQPPEVVFFERKAPVDIEASGLYVGYADFTDYRRELGLHDVPLTTLYHNLVLFAARGWPEMHHQAVKHLRYNLRNGSCWNVDSWTHKYHLLIAPLIPYVDEKAQTPYKIPGVGAKGRMIMRAVLLDVVPVNLEEEGSS
jgi:hypothetical protein